MAADSIEVPDRNITGHSTSIYFADNEQARIAQQKSIELEMQKYEEQEKQTVFDLK